MTFQNAQYTRTEVPALPGDDGSLRQSNIYPRFHFDYRRTGKGELNAVEMVELLIAGDTKNAPVLKVTDMHRGMYAKQYEAFKNQEAFVDEGTPLTAWGALHPGQARALMAMNIMTVEQLADISDAHCGGFMGGLSLRDRAKQYVALMNKNSEVNKIVAEMQALKADNERLQNQVTEIATIRHRLDAEEAPDDAPDAVEHAVGRLEAAVEDADEKGLTVAPPQPTPAPPQTLAERFQAEPAKEPNPKAPAKRRPGRPKGSKTKSTAA